MLVATDTEETDRVGPWIKTISGRRFYFKDAYPEDIYLRDISMGLAREQRFANQMDEDYTVLCHVFLVKELLILFCEREQIPCTPAVKLQAFHHDSPEAYLHDLPTPLKRLLPYYEVLEGFAWNTIAKWLGVPRAWPHLVTDADHMAQLIEAKYNTNLSDDWVKMRIGQWKCSMFSTMEDIERHEHRVLELINWHAVNGTLGMAELFEEEHHKLMTELKAHRAFDAKMRNMAP